MPVLDGIWERIIKCAQAGAPASETRMEMELINSSFNTLPNDFLADLVDRNFRLIGGVTYNPGGAAICRVDPSDDRRRRAADRRPGKGRAPRRGPGGRVHRRGRCELGAADGRGQRRDFCDHTWQASACAPA